MIRIGMIFIIHLNPKETRPQMKNIKFSLNKTILAGLAMIGLLVSSYLLFNNHHKPEPGPSREQIIQNYRDSIRDELITEVNIYIYENHPKTSLTPDSIVDLCLSHNFDIVFALAQGVCESCLGTAGLANRTNSVWNVGAFDGRNFAKIKATGFVYPTPDHSIEPYIILIKTRYLGDHKTFDDLFKNFVVVGTRTRYATDPDYEKKLKRTYDVISQQTSIKELQEQWHIPDDSLDIP